MSITKTGIWTSNNFKESAIDTTIHTTSDGAKWIRIFHHNNPASGKVFSTSDNFADGVAKSIDVWFNINLCNKITSWELMVKQKVDASSTEEIYRWKQSYNPMIATSSQVSAANITRTTGTGYNTGSYGGLYKSGSGIASYLIAAPTWWGALGATSPYQGGIPGWEGKVIKTGYIDLYLRIDDTTLLNASISKTITTSPCFYEI